MHFVIIPINMRIFASKNKKWKDLSSLQPRKKMLKHIFDFLPPYSVRTRIITITNFLI